MASTKNTLPEASALMNFELSSVINVRVGQGPSEKVFVVHEHFTRRSEYFRCAMNGNWAESDNRTIHLKEEDPEVFSHYLHIVYTDRFPFDCHSHNGADFSAFTKHQEQLYAKLIKVYILAERLLDTMTKDAIVRQIMARFREKSPNGSFKAIGSKNIVRLYNGTTKNSQLRRLVVDMWTTVEPDVLDMRISKLPEEFLGDLAVVLRRQLGKDPSNIAFLTDVEAYLEK